jgi:hypothetical protein
MQLKNANVEIREPLSTMKHPVAGSIPFTNKHNLPGTQCAITHVSSRDGFFGEIYVFLQIC